jgi:HD superfamily phosphohydrolase
MYKQVYFHRVRRAYDIHLKDFLKDWLAGHFPTALEGHLRLTDNEVMAALLAAARDVEAGGHIHAKRFVERQHFKMLYERSPADQKINRAATDLLFDSLVKEFGADCIRRDSYTPRAAALDFPVIRPDNRIESSLNLSETLQRIPSATFDLILCDRAILTRATSFLKTNRDKIITPVKEVAS